MTTPSHADPVLASNVPTGGVQFTRRNLADLDEGFYVLDPDEQAFLSSQTGISAPEELKKHICQVQKEAYSVSPRNVVRLISDRICPLDPCLPVYPRVRLREVSRCVNCSAELTHCALVMQTKGVSLSRIQGASEAGEGAAWCTLSRYWLLCRKRH